MVVSEFSGGPIKHVGHVLIVTYIFFQTTECENNMVLAFGSGRNVDRF